MIYGITNLFKKSKGYTIRLIFKFKFAGILLTGDPICVNFTQLKEGVIV